jgi:hypothetical protein
MQEKIPISKTFERGTVTADNAVQYHSVEFSIDGLNLNYHFKIWRLNSMSMCLLVNESSDLLNRLKVGDTLRMRYYSEGSSYPSDYQKTAIRQIVKNDTGRFKGHYLIGLEILERQGRHKIH